MEKEKYCRMLIPATPLLTSIMSHTKPVFSKIVSSITGTVQWI